MTQGFPNEVDWCGDNLGKMAKNCMKMTKSAFLGQDRGDKPILRVVGGISP